LLNLVKYSIPMRVCRYADTNAQQSAAMCDSLDVRFTSTLAADNRNGSEMISFGVRQLSKIIRLPEVRQSPGRSVIWHCLPWTSWCRYWLIASMPYFGADVYAFLGQISTRHVIRVFLQSL